ncbi:MAG: hypothetical protein ACOH1M_03820 [Rhodoglobus sp.]
MTEAPSQPIVLASSPESQIGLSYAEVLYLLAMKPGLSADRTRESLRLDDVEDFEKIALVGASCLMARGLLAYTEDGKSIGAIEQALYIRVVLTNATQWTEFQVTDGGDAGDTGFFIESSQGQLLLQPRAFDTWWFVLLDPDAPPEEILTMTALEWGDSAPEMAVFIRRRSLELDRSFTIHVDKGSWAYAFGVTDDPEPDERHERASRDDVTAALRSFAVESIGAA